MSSSNIPTRLTIRLPGPSRQGIPGQQTPTADKENISTAALAGGDVVRPHCPNISPAEVVEDMFYVPLVSPRHPSEFWLNNPAWIDGAIDPPHFYHTRADIAVALRAAGCHVPQPLLSTAPLGGIQPASPASDVTTEPASPVLNTVPVPFALAVIPLTPKTVVNAPVEIQGRLTSVTMMFDEIVPGATHNSKLKLKKVSEVKSNLIDFDNLSHVEVIKRIFSIHGIGEKYDVSAVRSPDFKLWYSGLSGGKSGAATISTNDDYSVLVGALHKKPNQTNISITFDLDSILAFKIRIKRALALEDSNLMGPGRELSEGVKVLRFHKIPQLDMYSNMQQLHGIHSQHIKNEWQCQQHLGENGRPGACYVTPNGIHIGLNIHRLASWAAAMAAGEATKYQPPNIPDFDSAHDGGGTMSRSRGHSGPVAQPTAGPSSSTAEQAISMMTAFFSAQAKAPPAAAPVLPEPIFAPPPIRQHNQSLVTFPLPTPAIEVQRFLEDF
ncbi:hypothetical protein PILCRDRAFT_93651 [Piloderma croceum F 1598]|uniref:Uncharacterized protein n=1 Tax=Piloderma croceum (strain F 1598) TaxID=765440 RepID=A0A0C3EVU2_PILCF|nr:hypothetical protein PILCRDRAFT_93651 [Piloderma croceum F 1598]